MHATNAAAPPTTPPAPEPPVVLFDGVCNLCNGAVRFILRRDRRGLFRFASLDSAAARALLGETPGSGRLPDSLFLVERDRAGGRRLSSQSTAVLRIARRLRWPWPAAYALIAVPRPLRDWAYSVVARNRYRWFGRRDSCEVPTPELRARFLH